MTRNTAAAKKIVEPDNTVSEPARAPQLQPYHYKPGQSGNPSGRPRGARSKLSESVIAKLLASFEAHGDETIERVRTHQPAAYLAACVSLLPKQQEKLDSPFADLTDDELELLEQFLKSTRAKQITTIDADAPSATSDIQTALFASAIAQPKSEKPE